MDNETGSGSELIIIHFTLGYPVPVTKLNQQSRRWADGEW
jgi:hypothetical protein